MPDSDFKQHDRQMEIHTPLGKDALLLLGFEGAEEFNKLYSYKLQLLSTKDSIAAKDIVGKPVTFSVNLRDKAPRYFHGYVARFGFKGKDDRFSKYVAEIVPWTWFLTQTRDCRMFQDKTVPQIIQEVFKDFSIAKFDVGDIRGTHEKWDYCVQYRESDFDFISRLAEREGIYFYFRHEDGKHTMVFGDSARGYKAAEENEARLKANFSSDSNSDNLLDWERLFEFRPAKYASADYNFETPSATMEAKASGNPDVPDTDKFEIYEYPGGHESKAEGEADARIRLEEIAAHTDVVNGKSVNASWGPGRKFKVEEHYISSEEGNEYVVSSVIHKAKLTGDYHGGPSAELEYTNTFTAIPAAKNFRPERVTPKPVVQGCQTAMVVGPPGETIPVDKYGRVKVHFYWDRRSKKDDTSSCWIRVSQTSGGAGWGAMNHPHAGHEVIVSFIEGDPDRPIITGRVYNGENASALDAVAKKSQSAIHDHGGNHIIMEGEAGNQRIKMHSPHSNTTLQLGSPNFSWDGLFAGTKKGMKFLIGEDYESVTDRNNTNVIKGISRSTVIGWHYDNHVGGHEDTHLGAHMDTHAVLHADLHLVALHMDVHYGAHVEMHGGFHANIERGSSYDDNQATELEKGKIWHGIKDNAMLYNKTVIKKGKKVSEEDELRNSKTAEFNLEVTKAMKEKLEELETNITKKLTEKIGEMWSMEAAEIMLESKDKDIHLRSAQNILFEAEKKLAFSYDSVADFGDGTFTIK